MQRQHYLQRLRALIKEYGADNIVYVDESGFKSHTHRDSGWALRGKKIYCDVQGKKDITTNLIMAQRGREWLAPMLFQRSCTAATVNAWLEQALFKELERPSVIIMDNAPFHCKTQITDICAKNGHVPLFLPPYSPDFNPIEQSFAILKKRRLQNHDNAIKNLLMQKSI